jgi:tyrosine-protein kinase Etk/Wzc
MDLLEKEKNESLDYLRIIIKNWIFILIFVCVTCVTAFIVTLFIPKEYTTTAVVFPTETNAIEDVIRNPQFGYDVEADRLIQVLQSRSIRDSIIKYYNLETYYDIDKDKPDWYSRLQKKYEEDITCTKTVFMSVVISVRNRDPEKAADIANRIISLVNATREKLLKQNLFLALHALKKEYNIIKNDLDSLTNVVNDMTRTKSGMKQFIQNERYISLIFDKTQFNDAETAKALQLVINMYNLKLGWFYDIQSKLKNAELMSQRPLPSIYVIESAIPSFKKSYPKFSINLLVAFVGSFIFISFTLYFYHKIRYIRSQMNS